jgi:pyruvate dehydrogenase E1 component alpha subunit
MPVKYDNSTSDLLELYYQMVRSRLIQEKLQQLHHEKIITTHLYLELGEEAITVGCDAALEKDDYLAAYWRGDSSCLLRRGMSLKTLMCWWLGKESDDGIIKTVLPTSYGNIGMHLLPRTDSCLGSEMDIAAGAALALKIRKRRQAVAVVIGEGATNRSNFHESMTFSSLLKLPLVYICRINGWAMSTPTNKTIPVEHVADMAPGYGVRSYSIDGNDVLAVQDTIQQALALARNGAGPVLVEARTYRMGPHSGNDEDDYRPAGEKEFWQKRDPISNIIAKMKKLDISSEKIEKIRADCLEEIEETIQWALQQPVANVDKIGNLQQEIVNRMWRRD